VDTRLWGVSQLPATGPQENLYAVSLAAGKSTPDAMTVREAAATVVGSPEARRRQIGELAQL
jgi:hypothetical protein